MKSETMLVNIFMLVMVIILIVSPLSYLYGQITEYDRIETKLSDVSTSTNYLTDSRGNTYYIVRLNSTPSDFLWNTTIIDP